MSIQTIRNAQLLEIGQIKKSNSWTNVYLKFLTEEKEEIWLYYSEHESKPQRLKQIHLLDSGNIQTGMLMTVQYEIKQSKNKTTSLRIKDLCNYKPLYDF